LIVSARVRFNQSRLPSAAEDYHQQYLAKNPNGYCGLGGTGMSCPVGVANVVDDATAEAE
jgi:peptide methionine sulfoxide reductase MsrA